MVSHLIAQMAAFPFSITKAAMVPSSVPNRQIQTVRESSAGYVSRVIAYKKTGYIMDMEIHQAYVSMCLLAELQNKRS